MCQCLNRNICFQRKRPPAPTPFMGCRGRETRPPVAPRPLPPRPSPHSRASEGSEVTAMGPAAAGLGLDEAPPARPLPWPRHGAGSAACSRRPPQVGAGGLARSTAPAGPGGARSPGPGPGSGGPRSASGSRLEPAPPAAAGGHPRLAPGPPPLHDGPAGGAAAAILRPRRRRGRLPVRRGGGGRDGRAPGGCRCHGAVREQGAGNEAIPARPHSSKMSVSLCTHRWGREGEGERPPLRLQLCHTLAIDGHSFWIQCTGSYLCSIPMHLTLFICVCIRYYAINI